MISRRTRFTVAAALLSLASSATAHAAADDDLDDDGTLDVIDNCLDVANPMQGDTDRDGFGNPCDGDFDDSGWIDDDDRELMLAVMEDLEAGGGEVCGPTACGDPDLQLLQQYAADFDLNEDGRLDEADVEWLQWLMDTPPGPRLDTDADGVPDADDRCPEGATSEGEPFFHGCTAAEVLAHAHRVGSPVRDRIDRVRRAKLTEAALEPLDEWLAPASDVVANALDVAAVGNACEAAYLLEETHALLGEASDSLLEPPEDLPPEAFEGGGDITLGEAIMQERGLIRALVGRAEAETISLHLALAELCETGESYETSGLVVAIDDARGAVKLDTGEIILYGGDGPQLGGALAEGVKVDASATRWNDGSTLGTWYGGDDAVEPTDPPKFQCIRLELAPYQDPTAAPIRHYPKGYLRGGLYEIERATGLAARRVCPSSPGPAASWNRYSLEIRADFGSGNSIVIAPDLDEYDAPVAIPAPVLANGTQFDLRVESRVQTCALSPNLGVTCSSPQALDEIVFPVRVRETGAFCALDYAETVLDVDDQIGWDYRTTSIVSTVAPLAGGTSLGVSARARTSNGWGTETVVGFNQPFAVHNWDYYPIHDVGGAPSVAAAAAAGVDHASAVAWPSLHGLNAGYPFQYACTTPQIVRDVIDFCPGETVDSYFRLPFHESDETWTQSQGSLSGGTHGNGYAYDMITTCGSAITAARAGVVEQVAEGEWRQDPCLGDTNCTPCDIEPDCLWAGCCPMVGGCGANVAWVRHQDGTYGQYNHMRIAGVMPEVNDVLPRGATLGYVGVTGNTNAPHLHLAWKTQIGNGASITRPMLFEAVDPLTVDDASPSLFTCYEPHNFPENGSQHHALRSTNG
jgi:murein DD-endopeptidase MepM/ murein hydrolase activator NlpD